MKNIFTAIILILIVGNIFAQETSIKDLDFLIGEWQVREDNLEKTWWEESKRIARYVMDSTYIELESTAISSSGKERTYRWYIHYNSKKQQFEMVSMFSNWHKVQFDILTWNPIDRKLTIRNAPDPTSDEFHERLGEIIFEEDFNQYIWEGENKYGDPKEPGIWKYVEKGNKVLSRK